MVLDPLVDTKQSLTCLSQDIIVVGVLDVDGIDLTLRDDENSDLRPTPENKAGNGCDNSTATGYTAKLSDSGSEEKSDSSTGDDDVCINEIPLVLKKKHVSFDESRTIIKEADLDISAEQDETQQDEDLLVEEYRNEIERSREVIANLATNVAVLDCGHCEAEFEINSEDDEEYAGEVYIDLLLKEEEMLLKGEKLHQSNRKLRRRLRSEIKLSTQLSLNLKTAAENITKVSKERDEWKAKYKALEKLYVEESAQGKFD